MAISTATMKNALAAEYASLALYGALYTTAPSGSPGTEPSGGTPPYARKPLTWSTPAGGSISATVTFDVPAGTNIVGTGTHSAATAGTYYDGNSVATQVFSGQGSLTVTFTFTEV